MVDASHRDLDPQPLQPLLVEQNKTLEGWIGKEEFDSQGLPSSAVDKLEIAHCEPGALQEPSSLPQIAANCIFVSTYRIGVDHRENLRRHLFPDGFKDLELLAARQSGGREISSFKIAVDALVLAVEDLAVESLKIEREVECATKPGILEPAATDVERECLHETKIADWEFLTDDPFIIDCRKPICRRPIFG